MKTRKLSALLYRLAVFAPGAALVALLNGCGGNGASVEDDNGLTRVILQTDWYAQPEHGGFYQAVAEGYYAEVGLDVEILPGGPNALVAQKVAQGRAHFAIGRSDDVIIAVARGVPLVMAGALMQRDPQAIMFHKGSGIEDFEDLDGRTVMTTPGSAFIEIMERTFNIDVAVTPLDYGMNRFLADENFIQQCFITNEPYYVAREGADAGVLLLSDSGFEPYRVWYCRKSYAEENPEIVRAFTEASIRGWREYLHGDRTKANALIAERNPKMDAEFMAFSANAMKEHKLVSGIEEHGDAIGLIQEARIQKLINQLHEIGMIDRVIPVEEVFTDEYLPTELRDRPAVPSISWTPQREDWSDLEVVGYFQGVAPGEPIFIGWEAIASLPSFAVEETLEVAPEKRMARGVYLRDLIAALGPPAGVDLVLADCSDGYQSNFTTEVITRNEPYVLISIDETSLPAWVSAQGHPEWGPYIISTRRDEGLLDPANKRPWGVERLVLTRYEQVVAPLYERSGATGNTIDLKAGIAIFANNCASCHNYQSTLLGGDLSTRNFDILKVFAENNRQYFIDMLFEPVATNPTAEKMPAHPHYTDAEVDNLIAFFTAYQRD